MHHCIHSDLLGLVALPIHGESCTSWARQREGIAEPEAGVDFFAAIAPTKNRLVSRPTTADFDPYPQGGCDENRIVLARSYSRSM